MLAASSSSGGAGRTTEARGGVGVSTKSGARRATAGAGAGAGGGGDGSGSDDELRPRGAGAGAGFSGKIFGRTSPTAGGADSRRAYYHTVAKSEYREGRELAQSVLDGIDPDRLDNPANRFGKAFYLSENSVTTLAELNHHGRTGTHTIRFSVNAAAARLLDLTNPDIAREWGYVRSDHYTKTQAIGTKALKAGYNVIRFPSERGMGANLAVLSDFGKILVPQMVVPAEEFDSAILTALSNELGGR